MDMCLPPIVQRPSPNYTPTLIKHDMIVVHRTEGGYAGACTWLCDPRAKASAPLIMKADGTEVSQLVPLQYKSWHACAYNGVSIGLEIEGYSAQGMTTATMHSAARIVAWLCRIYSIPPTWASGGKGRGVVQHHDLGIAGGGHTDCFGVGSPDWLHLLDMVKDAYDAFGSSALPPWALHGLPQAHEVATPSDAPPTPSHGGAVRAEIAERINPPILHATKSGYPTGSTADLQWMLNQTGAHPALIVDGWAGTNTRNAVQHFQALHGLYQDGIAGPATLATLRLALP